MKRIEDVLGHGWEHYAKGQKLQSKSAAFRKKLDTRPVFEV
jgi:dynein heavy chain 1